MWYNVGLDYDLFIYSKETLNMDQSYDSIYFFQDQLTYS